jgi:rhodanese-related sulfurtransferase
MEVYMNEISIDDLMNLDSSSVIIDIRDNYKYNLGKISNAINVPVNFLVTNPKNYINHNQRYYIYCDYGYKSKAVCERLLKLGYDVVNVLEGYNGYLLYKHKKNIE